MRTLHSVSGLASGQKAMDILATNKMEIHIPGWYMIEDYIAEISTFCNKSHIKHPDNCKKNKLKMKGHQATGRTKNTTKGATSLFRNMEHSCRLFCWSFLEYIMKCFGVWNRTQMKQRSSLQLMLSGIRDRQRIVWGGGVSVFGIFYSTQITILHGNKTVISKCDLREIPSNLNIE